MSAASGCVRLPARGTALLEDLGNLTANELYDPAGAGENAAPRAFCRGWMPIAAQCENFIVVSNEVFSGGADYAGDTERYLLALAQVNNALAARADPWCGWCAASLFIIKEWKNDVLQTIAVAFAMFSAVPVPQFAWNQKNMRYAHVRLSAHRGGHAGAVVPVRRAAPADAPARAAGFCLMPVWVTGGIHLDGYADTCDALSSYGDREKKLEILKDPHCGAFAVIRLCSYFAAYLCPLPPAWSSRPGWACAGRWLWCWNGHFPALRWHPFPWRKTPALPTLLPVPQTAPPCAMC